MHCELDNAMTDLPDFLRRDANNVAPYMVCKYPNCDGGPATGYCMNVCKAVHPALLDAVFSDDMRQQYEPMTLQLPHVINLSNSLPNSCQDWVPPWHSTICSHDA